MAFLHDEQDRTIGSAVASVRTRDRLRQAGKCGIGRKCVVDAQTPEGEQSQATRFYAQQRSVPAASSHSSATMGVSFGFGSGASVEVSVLFRLMPVLALEF